jgi:hypothetical protein
MKKRAIARMAKDKKSYAELKIEKPKALGRGLSAGVLQQALAGRELPRLVRKKIARAVSSALVSKKQEPVDTRKLFADVKSRKGKAPKK